MNNTENHSSEKNRLTEREMKVLAYAWQCFESHPKVDTNKLAQLAGYTPQSASVTLGKIKRKLALLAEVDSSKASSSIGASPSKAGAASVSEPATPRKRKKGTATPQKMVNGTRKVANTTATNEDGGEDTVVPVTPSKEPHARKPKAQPPMTEVKDNVKVEVKEEDELMGKFDANFGQNGESMFPRN